MVGTAAAPSDRHATWNINYHEGRRQGRRASPCRRRQHRQAREGPSSSAHAGRTPRLYYFPGNANLAPHIVLEEIGVPLRARARRSQERRAQVRCLPGAQSERRDSRPGRRRSRAVRVGGDLPVPRATSIRRLRWCLRCAPPSARIATSGSCGARTRCRRCSCTTSIRSAWSTTATRPRPSRSSRTRRNARRPMLDQLDAQLASHGGDWMLRSGYSVVDPFAFMLCRWTRGFQRPARSLRTSGRICGGCSIALRCSGCSRPKHSHNPSSNQIPWPCFRFDALPLASSSLPASLRRVGRFFDVVQHPGERSRRRQRHAHVLAAAAGSPSRAPATTTTSASRAGPIPRPPAQPRR